MNALRLLTAAAVLALATALPASATVTERGRNVTAGPVAYKTVLAPDYRGVGEYDGSLTLTIGEDGIVNGYFREDGGWHTSTVTGGITGDRIWLDLGTRGLSHIEGTYDGYRISAGTYLGGANYFTFTATPQNP